MFGNFLNIHYVLFYCPQCPNMTSLYPTRTRLCPKWTGVPSGHVSQVDQEQGLFSLILGVFTEVKEDQAEYDDTKHHRESTGVVRVG